MPRRKPGAPPTPSTHKPHGGFAGGNPYRWQPGCASPNPGGRPKGAAAHARRCREIADELLAFIGKGNCSPGVIAAYKAVAAKGGYLDADKMLRLELERTRLGAIIARLEGMSEGDRDRLLTRMLTEPYDQLSLVAAEEKDNEE